MSLRQGFSRIWLNRAHHQEGIVLAPEISSLTPL